MAKSPGTPSTGVPLSIPRRLDGAGQSQLFLYARSYLIDGENLRWEDMPVVHPGSFTREFAEWCVESGVKGKYSVVPCPAALGRIDEGWLGLLLPTGDFARLGAVEHVFCRRGQVGRVHRGPLVDQHRCGTAGGRWAAGRREARGRGAADMAALRYRCKN